MKKETLKQIRQSKAGMTLMEIILVFSLLAVLGTIVVRNLLPVFFGGQIRAAKLQMENLGQDLERYLLDCGRYPSTGQGLEALISAPTTPPECKGYNPLGYLTTKSKKAPSDPWGNAFQYKEEGGTFQLKSFGQDGQEGGDGANADIVFPEE